MTAEKLSRESIGITDVENIRNKQLRFQAACAAMQGLMSSTQTNFAAGTAEERKAHLAKVSVEYADALLKELEK